MFPIIFIAALGQVPTLEDEKLNEHWLGSRQTNLSKVTLMINGQMLDGNREIGPEGVRRTLATMEFPWKNPGGRNDSSKSLTIRTVYPPKLEVKPVTLKLRVPSAVSQGRISEYKTVHRDAWQYAVGSTFFELHYHPRKHACELRCIRKTKDGYGFDNYEVRIFQPELPNDMKPASKVYRKVSSRHPMRKFEAEGWTYLYKDSNVNWKEYVLSKPWIEVTGHDHHMAGLGDGFLFPKYDQWFTFITGSTHATCKQCHQSTGLSVDQFELFRDWYGFIPGSDGVFRAHDPVDRRRSTLILQGGRGRWVWQNN